MLKKEAEEEDNNRAMAIWPFGRKNKSKAPSTPDEQAMATSKKSSPEVARRETDRQGSDRSIPTMGRASTSRKDSQKRPRSSSRKLSKSNGSGTNYRASEKSEAIPPIPLLPEEHRKQLNEKSGANKLNQQPINPTQRRNESPSYYLQNPLSASSLQPEKFSVLYEPPTLQGKRSAKDNNLPRRKSSKRKANDHAREQEVKAMSSPIPIPRRPVSHQPGLLARDSRQMREGLNRNGQRPMSDVSLPMKESMQSQLSLSADQHAFKVSAFDALSPRPTIRYSGNPRSPGSSNQPSRTSTRKEKQPTIPEESMQSMNRKRIANLADDMDSPSLRELMDRDQRRHEKRRHSEHEKLQRRLEKRAAKQREEEVGEGEGAGHQGRVAAAAEASTAPKLSDTLAAPPAEEGTGTRTPESWLHDPSREHLVVKDPFHDPIKGGSTSHLAPATPDPNEDPDEPVLETAKAVRLSSASMSPPTSPTRHLHEPSSLSQMSSLVDPPEPPPRLDVDRRRDSDNTSGNRFSSNLKSIFRRSDTRVKRDSIDRGRFTPSEFSNTSRDSIQAQMPPSAFMRIPRARSGTPVRTQSRFREDLPELPNSPPDSRIQSPEVLPKIPGSRGNDTALGVDPATQRLSDIHPAYRDEVALSRNASLRAKSPEDPGANLSQSLASVDSEGSWLTGKPVKRMSGPLSRDSAGSLAQQLRALRGPEDRDMEYDEEPEPPGTPEAEKYMGSLSPAPAESKPPVVPQRRRPRMTSFDGGDDDDEGANNENDAHDLSSSSLLHHADRLPPSSPSPLHVTDQEGGTWHGPVGKHPTIIRPSGPGPRARSREGLLNDFQHHHHPHQTATTTTTTTAGEAATSPASAESSPSPSGGDGGDYSPVSPEDGNGNNGNTIHRATSVDLGSGRQGHARHISAGSARLLQLPQRGSGEFAASSSSAYGSKMGGGGGAGKRISASSALSAAAAGEGGGVGVGRGEGSVLRGPVVENDDDDSVD